MCVTRAPGTFVKSISVASIHYSFLYWTGPSFLPFMHNFSDIENFKFSKFHFLLIFRFIEATEAMLQKDISDNKAIGKHGAEAILAGLSGDGQTRVLTHCNTGSLATGTFYWLLFILV